MTMRKIVVILVALLCLTGLAIGLARIAGVELPGRKITSLAHIFLGLFFVVIFPLYAWDHVMARTSWLKRLSGVTLSGSVQLVSAIVLIFTGMVVLLYGGEVWPQMLAWHHGLTYALAAALLAHFFSDKAPPG